MFSQHQIHHVFILYAESEYQIPRIRIGHQYVQSVIRRTRWEPVLNVLERKLRLLFQKIHCHYRDYRYTVDGTSPISSVQHGIENTEQLRICICSSTLKCSSRVPRCLLILSLFRQIVRTVSACVTESRLPTLSHIETCQSTSIRSLSKVSSPSARLG